MHNKCLFLWDLEMSYKERSLGGQTKKDTEKGLKLMQGL